MNENLNRLHETLTELLDYFVSVCEAHHLRYVLLYGTALGAYRHQGFIPWDDDLDVGMPRADYEKLLTILRQSPDPRYKLQNEQTEPNWFLGFSKIRKQNTLFVEHYLEDLYRDNGIYIDIFPLDNLAGTGGFAARMHNARIRYLIHCLKFLACPKLYRHKDSAGRYGLECLLTLPVRLMGRRRCLKRLNRLCTGTCPADKAACLVEYDDSHSYGIPADVYFPAGTLTFEGKSYCAPGRMEDYLTAVYGPTYMQLPPPEQRVTHEPVALKF